MTQANEDAVAAAPESRRLVPCDKHALAIGQVAIIHCQRWGSEDTGRLVTNEITAVAAGIRGLCGGESNRLCTWAEWSS